jgi:hypothetical protein
MGLLFRLPLLIFEFLLRRVFGHDPEQERYQAAARAARPAPTPPPPFTAAPGADAAANGAPPPTADEAIARRFAREAAATAGAGGADFEPPTPLRPIGDAGHVETEAEVVESFGPADDVTGTITVEEPWDGYAAQPASAIVQRLRGADAATKAVVALYERGHKNRSTVLKATG